MIQIFFCGKICTFSRILGELVESEIINREAIESGERFQFVAISNAWKNQRRKRRQQAREQQNADNKMEIAENTNNPEENADVHPAKRTRFDEDERQVQRIWDRVKDSETPPLLHIEVSVVSKTLSELKAVVEIKLTYLNGTSGLNGVYELLQYIQNKWSK